MKHLSFYKFKNLIRALHRGNPNAFDGWYRNWLYDFLTKEGGQGTGH